jgi:hypothetical protein
MTDSRPTEDLYVRKNNVSDTLFNRSRKEGLLCGNTKKNTQAKKQKHAVKS